MPAAKMKSKINATDKYLRILKQYIEENDIVLAVISGLLLFLSFPKYGFGSMAWLALVPLFFAIKKSTSAKHALVLGFISGIVGYVGIFYWITYVVVNYGYLPLYLGIIIMLLLVCYLSIYIALFAVGIYFLRGKNYFCLAAPALWVCLEYLKSYLFTGFPWENLGYSQYLNAYFIQFADVFGVFGLSFIIAAVNAVIFTLLVKRTKGAFVSALALFLVLSIVYIYGYFRIENVRKSMNDAPGMEVSLIQGNIDQSIKWDALSQSKILNTYLDLSAQNSPQTGGLIVWPETALPFNYQQDSFMRDQVNNLPKEKKSWFLFGAVTYIRHDNETVFLNSAYLLSPDGVIADRYDKVHLVPYGEYVPMRNIFPFINKLTAGIGDFSIGDGYKPLLMGDKNIGVMICYEGILPRAAKIYKNQSADLLVNVTNDAWFGPTSAPYQHFSMSLFRAIETRLYLVRAANTGISGIVDPTGKIVSKTDIFETDALRGDVKFINVETFYTRHGDVFVVVCFIISAFFIIWNLRRRFVKWLPKTFRNR
jgi:apolipoprotein N-acyltransferase